MHLYFCEILKLGTTHQFPLVSLLWKVQKFPGLTAWTTGQRTSAASKAHNQQLQWGRGGSDPLVPQQGGPFDSLKSVCNAAYFALYLSVLPSYYPIKVAKLSRYSPLCLQYLTQGLTNTGSCLIVVEFDYPTNSKSMNKSGTEQKNIFMIMATVGASTPKWQ